MMREVTLEDLKDEDIEKGRAYIYWNGKMWRIIKRDIPLAYYHWVQVVGYPNPIIMKPTDKAYIEGDEDDG